MFRYNNNNSFNNHTGYVGNSHYSDNNGSITAAQFRALIVINAKNASFQIAQEEHQLDMNNGGKKYHRVYHEPTVGSFFNIYPGEICFESTVLPHRNYDQQPYARACLNNQLITAEEKASLAGRSAASIMKRNMRIIGLAIKPYIWNDAISAHSPDPVLIASGLSSMYNSGKQNIEAGQTVIASFPDPDPWYNQSSSDKSLNIPEKRAIMESKPLTAIDDVLDASDIHDIIGIKHFARVVNLIVRENLAQQLGRIAAASSTPTNPGQVITDFMGQIQAYTGAGEPTEVAACRIAPEMDDLMKLVIPLPFKKCVADSAPKWATEFFSELLVVCCAISSHSASRTVGIAQTSAQNKKLFDIISTPAMESGVTRLLTTTYYEQTTPPVGVNGLVVALRTHVKRTV